MMNEKNTEAGKMPDILWESDGRKRVAKVNGLAIGHVAPHDFPPQGAEDAYMVFLYHSAGPMSQKNAAEDDVRSLELAQASLLRMIREALARNTPSDVLDAVHRLADAADLSADGSQPVRQAPPGMASANAARRLLELDREIQELNAERANLLGARRAAINFAAHDEVGVGQAGRLVTLDGVQISGRNDVLYGRAAVISACRNPDGSIALELKETIVAEDSVLASRDEYGEVEYLTVDGDIVPESKVKLVSAGA